MSPDELDVIRTLSHLFKSETEVELEDAERTLSFDLKFLNPDDAERAIRELVEKGWINQNEDEVLTPALSLHMIEKTPLSWAPRPSRLLNPVPFTDFEKTDDLIGNSDVETKSEKLAIENTKEDVNQIGAAPNSNDPRMTKERLLLGYIARKTGLPKAEITRRQKRKNKALEPSTSWICLALVAREQGLEMKEIVAALSTF